MVIRDLLSSSICDNEHGRIVNTSLKFYKFVIEDFHRLISSAKYLQEQFPYKIEHVYIVKPDGFWDKHKISLGLSKYTFEVRENLQRKVNSILFFQHSVESVESLTQAIDRNQLTVDLNGTFQYNHIRWLDFRLVRRKLRRLSPSYSSPPRIEIGIVRL